MDVIVIPLFRVLLAVVDLYMMVVFVTVIMSWLITFNVVNLSNRVVYIIWDICRRLTEPVLARIRQYLPDLGGIDLSPIVLLLGLWFLEMVIGQMMMTMMMDSRGYPSIPR